MLQVSIAGKHNIPGIRDMAYRIWPVAYASILQPKQIEYMLQLFYSMNALEKQLQSGHRFIIASEDGIAVGFASFSQKTPGTPEIFRLHKLYVLPGLQQKGVGKFLLNYIIETISAEGATMLELNVNRHNPALHFYTKLGFSISREEDIDIGEGYFMNDFVMEKKM